MWTLISLPALRLMKFLGLTQCIRIERLPGRPRRYSILVDGAIGRRWLRQPTIHLSGVIRGAGYWKARPRAFVSEAAARRFLDAQLPTWRRL